MVPGSAVSISPGNLLQMQILKPHPRSHGISNSKGQAQRSVFQQTLQVILMHAEVWEPLRMKTEGSLEMVTKYGWRLMYFWHHRAIALELDCLLCTWQFCNPYWITLLWLGFCSFQLNAILIDKSSFKSQLKTLSLWRGLLPLLCLYHPSPSESFSITPTFLFPL